MLMYLISNYKMVAANSKILRENVYKRKTATIQYSTTIEWEEEVLQPSF